MKAALAVIAVLVILALIVGGMYAGRRNEMVRLNEASQIQLGAGGRSPATPRRPHPQPRRHRPRFRRARTNRLRRHRQSPHAIHERANSRRQNRRQQPNYSAGTESPGPVRKLSPTEIQRKFPPPARRTSRHRKSHRRRTQALQRFHPGLQHLHRPVPQQHLRRMGRLQAQQRLLPGPRSITRSSRKSNSQPRSRKRPADARKNSDEGLRSRRIRVWQNILVVISFPAGSADVSS